MPRALRQLMISIIAIGVLSSLLPITISADPLKQTIGEYDAVADYLSIQPESSQCLNPDFSSPLNPNSFVRVNPKLNSEWKKKICRKIGIDVHQFCLAVKESCAQTYPQAKERGCWFREPKAQVLIWLDQEHIKKVKKHAIKYFDQAIKDPLLLSTCCGQNIKCKDFLSMTKFVITKTKHYLFKNVSYHYWVGYDHSGNFDHQTNEVTFDENRLAYGSPETTESILLHELGHTCTVARRIGADLKLDRFPHSSCDDEAPVAQDIEKVLGKKTADCIRAVSIAEQEAFVDPVFKKDKGCLNTWFHEAFATAVFSYRLKSLGHWGYHCGAPADETHGLTSNVMKCLLQRQSMETIFCKD